MAKPKMWRKSFQEYVKTLRWQAQLTQKELADAVGVNSNTVARWESDNPAIAREAYGQTRARLDAYGQEHGMPPLPVRRLRRNPLESKDAEQANPAETPG